VARVSINVRAIRDKAVKAFALVNTELHDEMVLEANDSKWSWPRATTRKSGQIVTSPRNIVDTGEFRDGIQMVRVSDVHFQHRFNAPHSLIVLKGAVIGGSSLPARDVTEQPLRNVSPNFRRFYAAL